MSADGLVAVRLDRILVDGAIQPREAIDPHTVEDYASAMQVDGWGSFPPLGLIDVGGPGESELVLFDGFTRYAAAQHAGLEQCLATIGNGTRDDAQWCALQANRHNGQRLNQADKRRAIRMALTHPNGRRRSDRHIADLIGCSHRTVARVRSDLEDTGQIAQSRTRVGGDGVERRLRETGSFAQSREPQHAGDDGDVGLDDVFGAPVGGDVRDDEPTEIPDVSGSSAPPWVPDDPDAEVAAANARAAAARAAGELDGVCDAGDAGRSGDAPAAAVDAPLRSRRAQAIARALADAEKALRRLYALANDTADGAATAADVEDDEREAVADAAELVASTTEAALDVLRSAAALLPADSISQDQDLQIQSQRARAHDAHAREADVEASQWRVVFTFWTLLEHADPPPEQWLPDGMRIEGGVFKLDRAPTEAEVRAMYTAAQVPASASVPGSTKSHIYNAVQTHGLHATLAAIYSQAADPKREGRSLSRKAQFLPGDAAEVKRLGYSVRRLERKAKGGGFRYDTPSEDAYMKAARAFRESGGRVPE